MFSKGPHVRGLAPTPAHMLELCPPTPARATLGSDGVLGDKAQWNEGWQVHDLEGDLLFFLSFSVFPSHHEVN